MVIKLQVGDIMWVAVVVLLVIMEMDTPQQTHDLVRGGSGRSHLQTDVLVEISSEGMVILLMADLVEVVLAVGEGLEEVEDILAVVTATTICTVEVAEVSSLVLRPM